MPSCSSVHRRSRLQADFSALQALVKRHNLNIPIVASLRPAGTWISSRLVHATVSPSTALGRGRVPKLSAYSSMLTATTANRRPTRSCAQILGQARRPLHYLAIPPSMFAAVAEGLAHSGCATDARVGGGEAVRARPPVGARSTPDFAPVLFPNQPSSGLTTSWARSLSRTFFTRGFANLFSNPCGIATYVRSVQINMARISASKDVGSSMKKQAPSAM